MKVDRSHLALYIPIPTNRWPSQREQTILSARNPPIPSPIYPSTPRPTCSTHCVSHLAIHIPHIYTRTTQLATHAPTHLPDSDTAHQNIYSSTDGTIYPPILLPLMNSSIHPLVNRLLVHPLIRSTIHPSIHLCHRQSTHPPNNLPTNPFNSSFTNTLHTCSKTSYAKHHIPLTAHSFHQRSIRSHSPPHLLTQSTNL